MESYNPNTQTPRWKSTNRTPEKRAPARTHDIEHRQLIKEIQHVESQPHNRAIPVGKYKGQLISTLATQFLLWFLSQENLRFKYGDTARSMMGELRARFNAPDVVETELMPADAGDLV